MAAVLADWRAVELREPLRGALRLAEVMTRSPAELTPSLVEELRVTGLDVGGIEEAANVIFHYNLINRLADALDFPLADEGQRPRLARLLNRVGKLVGGRRPSPSWMRDADGALRPVQVALQRRRLLEVPGSASPDLRRAAEAFTATLQGGARTAGELPPELEPYLRKLGTAAYKIVDEDFATLRALGLDDYGSFEVTFAGAFGAAVAPLERLFALLHGPRGGRLPHAQGEPLQ